MTKFERRSLFHWSSVFPIYFVLSLLVSGCDDSAIIWSVDVKSPDRNWFATAQTKQYGGLGTAGIVTTVYLERANTRDDLIEILQYSQEKPSRAPEADLKMRWIDNSHLEITYKGPRDVNFEAIKCAGIDIIVREKMN